MQPTKAGQELFGIEILRFLAALAILVWHYQHFFCQAAYDAAIAPSLRPAFPFYRDLELFFDYGLYAVQVFWIISGFVFMRRYYEVISAGGMTFEAFALRRISWLYPLHLVTLIAVAALQGWYLALHGVSFIYQDNGPFDFLAHVVLASNWFSWQPVSFNGPIWSVSVEMLVYGLFFAVCSSWRLPFASRPLHRLSVCAFGLFALTDLLPVMNPMVLMCGTYFLAGALAERLWQHRLALPVSAGLIAVLAAGFAVGAYVPNTFVALAFGVAAVVVGAQADRFVPTAWLRVPALLGNATYSSYLLHFPVQLAAVIAADSCGLSRDLFLNPLVFLAYIGSVIGGGLLVHRFFEMPAQDRLRTFALRRGNGLAPAPAE